MPQIPLLEPTVLQGVLEKIVTDDAFVMLNRVPKVSYTESGQVVTWDIVQGSRLMGRPNVPDSEAHIIPKHGRRQASASFIYYREKAIFQPTELYWVRAAGSATALQRAEEHVLDALTDLNVRMNNLIEYCLWQSLSGRLVLDFPDVQADVDYKFPASHLPTVGVPWNDAAITVSDIIADITAWKTLISTHGRVPAREVYTSPNTLRLVVDALVRSPGGAASASVGLTDRQREEYWSTGTLGGFMNLDWHTVDLTFEDGDGNLQAFIPDGRLIMGNFDQGRPIELFQGPTADRSAPQNHAGPFTKTWIDDDPSGQQILLENRFMPVVKRPESFVSVADVTA